MALPVAAVVAAVLVACASLCSLTLFSVGLLQMCGSMLLAAMAAVVVPQREAIAAAVVADQAAAGGGCTLSTIHYLAQLIPMGLPQMAAQAALAATVSAQGVVEMVVAVAAVVESRLSTH